MTNRLNQFGDILPSTPFHNAPPSMQDIFAGHKPAFNEPRPKLAKIESSDPRLSCATCPCYVWGERKCNALKGALVAIDIYSERMTNCPIEVHI